MTRKEALAQIKKYKYIIGETLNDDEVEDIVLSPTKADILTPILLRLNEGSSYEDLIAGYDDFVNVVVYDLDLFRFEGRLMWDYLDHVIKKHNLK